jgi:hypothetical protein
VRELPLVQVPAGPPQGAQGLRHRALELVLQRFKGAPPADIERVTAYVEAELAERKNQAQ